MPRGAAADRERQETQLRREFASADRLPAGPAEEPASPDIPPDRTLRFKRVSFSRMRTEWGPDERIKIAEITRQADQVLTRCFPEAYATMERLYARVRTPLTDQETGAVLKDPAGRTRWARDDRGLLIEDWTRLGDREREDLLFRITTHLFEWRQQAAAMWGSAMFAKGTWEEMFAFGFTSPRGSLTIDDRTHAGHLQSMEERYFAIFEAVLSKRADALIRSMERLEEMLMRPVK